MPHSARVRGKGTKNVMGKMLQPFMVVKQPSEYFQKNTEIPFNLPLNGKIAKGYVILSGDVVISGGTTNGVVNGEGGPINLIKKIIVRANPAAGSRYFGGEIVNCTPRALLRNAITERSKFLGEMLATANSNTLGVGAAATYTIYLAIPIYWADPNVARQYTTSLNADPSAYQSIQVIVQTGDLANCFTGNDRAADFSNLKVRWVDERHDYAGDTLCLFQEDHISNIAAAKEDFVDAAFKQDGMLLSMLVMTEVGAPKTLANSILKKMKLQGNGIAIDLEANDVRQRMFDDGWWDASENATGQYFVDFTDGNVFSAIPAPGLALTFDVNMVSASNVDGVHVFTRRFFPPSGFDPTGKAAK